MDDVWTPDLNELFSASLKENPNVSIVRVGDKPLALTVVNEYGHLRVMYSRNVLVGVHKLMRLVEDTNSPDYVPAHNPLPGTRAVIPFKLLEQYSNYSLVFMFKLFLLAILPHAGGFGQALQRK